MKMRLGMDDATVVVEFNNGSIKTIRQITGDETGNFEFMGMFGCEPKLDRTDVLGGIFFACDRSHTNYYKKGDFIGEVVAYRFIGELDPVPTRAPSDPTIKMTQIWTCWVEDTALIPRGIAFYKEKK